eukprot:5542976-Amphidinium_carterae.1
MQDGTVESSEPRMGRLAAVSNERSSHFAAPAYTGERCDETSIYGEYSFLLRLYLALQLDGPSTPALSPRAALWTFSAVPFQRV